MLLLACLLCPAQQPETPTFRTGTTLPAASPADPVIEKARQIALSFVETLPKYVARQETKRMYQAGGRSVWRMQDQISAELYYDNGKDHIRDVTLNCKQVDASVVQQSGAWSTGQFGDLLRDLFDRETRAAFRARSSTKVDGRDALVYSFSVRKETSTWQVSVGGMSYAPAYDGKIWLDHETARTLRFEMQVRGLPRDFPLERAESSTEFKLAPIGGRDYLLPAASTALGCTRGRSMRPGRGPVAAGSKFCAQNVIEFHDYKQFDAESNITF